MSGGHKTVSPAPGTIDDHGTGILDYHETGKILVFRTKTIRYPRSERRASTEYRTSVHLADSAGMIDAV